jgi:hypothetical protein
MTNKGRLELQKTEYLQEYGGRKMEEDTQAFNGMLEMWGIPVQCLTMAGMNRRHSLSINHFCWLATMTVCVKQSMFWGNLTVDRKIAILCLHDHPFNNVSGKGPREIYFPIYRREK